MTLRNIVIYIEAIDSKLLNEFYAKIGVNWLEMDDKLLYYACKKVILLLNKNNSQYSVTKLFFLTDSKDIKEFGASQLTLDSFEYLKDRLNSLNLLQLEQDTNKQIIPLLRVGDIEENKNKYEDLGSRWSKQKHKPGPEHYALEDENCALKHEHCALGEEHYALEDNHCTVDFEIYPQRKTPKGDVELLFNYYDFLPDEYYSEIIKRDDIKILALDPDGRHISIFPFGA